MPVRPRRRRNDSVAMQHQRGVVTWAKRYDLLISLLTFGREGALREKMLDLGKLSAGESVLDVGCGTGTLAIAAKRRVGAASVRGIDASPEMIARARQKASRDHVDAIFDVASAESLPFSDRQFDVVLSTVMLHHLRRAARERCVGEIRRVLKTGGRLLVIDFGVKGAGHRGPLAHFHKHGRVKLDDLVSLVADAGLDVMDSGPTGVGSLLFVLGMRGA
jgi:ubiquinone/menaquinone biosynthesis C-methylase UbiE